MTTMVPEGLGSRHLILLELVTDYVLQHREAWPDATSVTELMEWSLQQVSVDRLKSYNAPRG